MAAKLTLHELTGSPNNIKIRIALALKGLEYERVPLEIDSVPGDRSSIIALSTQPRTPVLKHGETVIFDSGGILRYLDANFPDTPRLFSEDYAEFGVIEEWEFWSKAELAPPIRAAFGECFAPKPDLAVCEKSCERIHEVSGRIEDVLAKQPFLLGEAPKAPDVIIAPGLNLAMLEPSPENGPIYEFFRANVHLGEGRERTREWVRKVMSYDPLFHG